MITIVLPTQQKMMMQEAIIQKLLLYFERAFSQPFLFPFLIKQMLNDLNHDLKTRSQNFISDETSFESHKLPFLLHLLCFFFSRKW